MRVLVTGGAGALGLAAAYALCLASLDRIAYELW